MNLNPQEMLEQTMRLGAELARANEEFVRLNTELAHAEVNYRRAKAKKIIELRDQKIPVSIIADLAKGDDAVSELMLQRDLMKALVDAERYHITSIQNRIRIGQSVIGWLKAELNVTG